MYTHYKLLVTVMPKAGKNQCQPRNGVYRQDLLTSMIGYYSEAQIHQSSKCM